MRYLIVSLSLLFLAACGSGTTSTCSSRTIFDANNNPIIVDNCLPTDA